MNSGKKKALVLALASSALALGCELVVDFDRTRIPVESSPEASTPDATPAADTGAPDTGATDAGTDATDAADAADAADAGQDADAA